MKPDKTPESDGFTSEFSKCLGLKLEHTFCAQLSRLWRIFSNTKTVIFLASHREIHLGIFDKLETYVLKSHLAL